MTPKPNTYYRTRDGRKAYVAAVLPAEMNAEYPVLGATQSRDGTWEDDTWRADGTFAKSEYGGRDLIEKWRESVKQTFWCNVYKNQITAAHDERHEAMEGRLNAAGGIGVDHLDTIRIEYEQGQSEGKWFREEA